MSYTAKTVALIDGDIPLYRVGFVCEHTDYDVYLEGEEEAGRLASFPNKTELNKWLKDNEGDYTITTNTWTDELSHAFHSVKLMIQNILEQTNASSYIIYLTGSNNFRNVVLPSYKAGRKPRPILYQDIKDYIIANYNTVVTDGIEADDALGIEQTATEYAAAQQVLGGHLCHKSVICTIDKDLLMIPGRHYNFVTDVHQEVSEEQGSYTFDCQLLTGDNVDNICGIKGLGPKTAEKLLSGKNPTERREIICNEYLKYWGEDFMEVLECNEKLLWILREPLSET